MIDRVQTRVVVREVVALGICAEFHVHECADLSAWALRLRHLHYSPRKLLFVAASGAYTDGHCRRGLREGSLSLRRVVFLLVVYHALFLRADALGPEVHEVAQVRPDERRPYVERGARLVPVAFLVQLLEAQLRSCLRLLVPLWSPHDDVLHPWRAEQARRLGWGLVSSIGVLGV